jgi:hypothetical protein
MHFSSKVPDIERFWREVDAKLTQLYIKPDDEQQVRVKLLTRVPRPKSW